MSVTTSRPAGRTPRRTAAPRNGRGVRVGRAIGTAGMVVCTVAAALPLVLLLFNALKDNGQIVAHPLALPTHPKFGNISDAWKGGDFGASLGGSFLNSVIVTSVTVVLVTALAALAGYALGSFRFRGEQYTTLAILILLAVPTQATLIPVFDMMGRWNLRNSFTGIILIYTAFWMPFSVLLMRAAFRTFPRELTEAARVDGAGELTIFFRVVAPVLKGPIVGVAVVNAIGVWSELLFSYVLLTEPDKRTLPAAIIAFTGNYVTNYRLLYAGLLITVLPILITYFFLSRMIRKGMSAGALK